MPSTAFTRLKLALEDVDAQLSHAKSFAGGKRGAPASAAGKTRPGRPFTRAATVLLAGAIEGYVEAVVGETAGHLPMTTQQRKDLKEQIRRSHGAGVFHVHALTAQIGLPFVADEIGWQGLPKGTGVRALLSDLATARNKIAHGSAPANAKVAEVERWRKLIERFAQKLDEKCAEQVKAVAGTAPW